MEVTNDLRRNRIGSGWAGLRGDRPAQDEPAGIELMTVKFYVGLHQPSDVRHFERACVSIHRLGTRRKPLGAPILLDSGAFTTILAHGGYPEPVSDYAAKVRRLFDIAEIDAAVAQDFMCEAHMLERTGLSIPDHQRLTIERYDALVAERLPVAIMPVLQGYAPLEYRDHLEAYGDRLGQGAWVGVGSVCKRNGSPGDVVGVLAIIKQARPDLRLHGFGLKSTALLHPGVRDLLFSADSMAWSYAARKQGRNGNDWREAQRFSDRVSDITQAPFQPWQIPLL